MELKRKWIQQSPLSVITSVSEHDSCRPRGMVGMESSSHFRKRAEECRALAEQAKTESTRLSLLRAAANYDRIADIYELTERAQPGSPNPAAPVVKKK
jgi:hypothetical protein